jgi:hypothetical protein
MFVPATAMHSSYRAGHTTVRTQLPAAANTITSASTARRSARLSENAGMPPRLIVMTWAPDATAQSIAWATDTCVIRITLSTALIGMWRASGAVPAMTSVSGETSTLAVPVPCPPLSPVSGSVGSSSPSTMSRPGATATPTSSG